MVYGSLQPNVSITMNISDGISRKINPTHAQNATFTSDTKAQKTV